MSDLTPTPSGATEVDPLPGGLGGMMQPRVAQCSGTVVLPSATPSITPSVSATPSRSSSISSVLTSLSSSRRRFMPIDWSMSSDP